MHAKSADSFKTRCRITGVLTARTPLHVGSGEMLYLRQRKTSAAALSAALDGDPDPQYNACVSGVEGDAARPVIMIPGSTLKGVVRSWLRRRGAPASLVERVFGYEVRGGPGGQGGKVEFHDAPLRGQAPGDNKARWWDDERKTCLTPGVALDPHTRTALNDLLYYVEYAPEGSTFSVTVTGQNLEDDERNLLCAALAQGFNDPDDPIHVGAGVADDWGRMAWEQTECAIIEHDDVKKWLAAGEPGSYEHIFRADPTPWTRLSFPQTGSMLRLDVRLQFTGAVLVNDPSQQQKRDESAGVEGTTHAAVKRIDGQYFLPGSSVRGALRAQVRRIWQTVAYGQDGYLRRVAAPEAKRQGDERNLPLFYRMLGAPGWRAPVRVPDFALACDAWSYRQEFVAIDRFTGGAAENKKFNAEALYAPEFEAVVEIDLARWKDAGVEGCAVLLLLYLLRDLQDGDIHFGFGRSKGYGACTAEITASCVGAVPDALYGGENLEAIVTGVLSNGSVLQNALLKAWDAELTTLVAQSAPAAV